VLTIVQGLAIVDAPKTAKIIVLLQVVGVRANLIAQSLVQGVAQGVARVVVDHVLVVALVAVEVAVTAAPLVVGVVQMIVLEHVRILAWVHAYSVVQEV
jgi:hypothetical protein